MTFKKGMIPWNKGKSRPLEVRLKISQKRKGQHNSPSTEFKKGMVSWNKGKHLWKNRPHPMFGRKLKEETIRKIRETKRIRFQLGLIKPPNKGKRFSEEVKGKMSKSKIGKPNPKSSETKRRLFSEGKLVPWNKGKPFLQKENNPFFNKKHSEKTKMLISEKIKEWHTKNRDKFLESRKKTSLKIKQLWRNPEFRKTVIQNSLKGLWKRPNSLERKMIEFIEENNLPFKFCGDGSFLIGFKNPDFVDLNNKICIEVSNRFHHKGDWETKRIQHFESFGWKCIVKMHCYMVGRNIC